MLLGSLMGCVLALITVIKAFSFVIALILFVSHA
jgi:hypothetical protein